MCTSRPERTETAAQCSGMAIVLVKQPLIMLCAIHERKNPSLSKDKVSGLLTTTLVVGREELERNWVNGPGFTMPVRVEQGGDDKAQIVQDIS